MNESEKLTELRDRVRELEKRVEFTRVELCVARGESRHVSEVLTDAEHIINLECDLFESKARVKELEGRVETSESAVEEVIQLAKRRGDRIKELEVVAERIDS